MRLASILAEPELAGLDIESPERILRHSRILARKAILRSVFEDFYRTYRALDERWFGDVPGLRVELGAGVSFFKQCFPDVTMTDIKLAPHLDAVVDAQAIPYADASVRALYGLNCFHHLPEPETFFREALRVLRPGGGVVLIEPFYGPLSEAVHKRLFSTECFVKTDRDWSSLERAAMLGANQALSYIVFFRDRARFTARHPELEIVHTETVPNYLRYLLSGGLNFRQLCPDKLTGLVVLMERFLRPLEPLFALHHAIVLRKRRSAR